MNTGKFCFVLFYFLENFEDSSSCGDVEGGSGRCGEVVGDKYDQINIV